jgi:HEAT repeat protein
MKTFVIVLALGALGAAAAQAQDQGKRITRVYLRNGNCVEGLLVGETPKGWTLRMTHGEITVRRDQVDHVEMLRMKNLSQPEPPPAAVTAESAPTPTTNALVQRALVASEESGPAPAGRKEALIKKIESGLEGSSAEAVRTLDCLNPEEVEKVTSAICDAGDPSALSRAPELLKSSRADLRASGVRIIAAHGGLDHRSEYRSMIEDPDPLVRRWVVASLGKIDDTSSFDVIGSHLIDPDGSVRAEARNSLFTLSSRHGLAGDLVRILLEKLYQSEGEACAEILSALGNCGSKESWEMVARYLHDRNTAVRAQAALALSRIAAPESGNALLERLEMEQEYWPRIQLAGAVQSLKLKKAVDPLLTWMEDEDRNIRMAAVRALRQITLQSFGMDRDRWVAWWQDAKPRE